MGPSYSIMPFLPAVAMQATGVGQRGVRQGRAGQGPLCCVAEGHSLCQHWSSLLKARLMLKRKILV